MSQTKSQTFRGVVGVSAVAALLGLGVIGCVEEPTDEPSPAPEARPASIAGAELAAGGRLDIYEPEAGNLVAVVRGTAFPESVEGLSPLAIYESLSGQPAPAALREAQARADLAGGRPRTTHSHGAKATDAQGLTASSFRDQFCERTDVDFDYCYTDRNSPVSMDETSVNWIHAHMDVQAGRIGLRMSKKRWGNWTTVFDDIGDSSVGVVTQSTGDNDTYLVQVYDVESDNFYHLAVHGER